MNDKQRQLPEIISSLLAPERYDHAVDKIALIETHISWVILTGPYAYKIKKPVNLGFLDFSTLEKRHFYCQEELRLNSRLAPSLYLEVVSITGSEAQAVFSGTGKTIEYAIKMVQFPQKMQMDHMLTAGLLQTEHIDLLANMVAQFHQQTDIANKDDSFGSPEKIYKPVRENFIQLEKLITDDSAIDKLARLERWTQAIFIEVKSVLAQRQRDGFIRECHGDLYLRNLVFINDIPVAFDCIEFDPELRWIDIISDVAFLIMDLQDRQQTDLAQRFLNAYLEETGDYSAVQVLRFYLVYRAMVRAKVEAISASQRSINKQAATEAKAAFDGYIDLAQSYLEDPKPMLIISYGMSGSGKSTLTQPLAEKLAAIRIRSDVERKRLFKVTEKTDSAVAVNAGIYSADASEKTYQHLVELADLVLNAGYCVIIDAACLHYEQRQLFHQLAIKNNVPFVILELIATPDTLRERINTREKEVSDADKKVLEHQVNNWQPLHQNEQANVISIDTELQGDSDRLVKRIMLHYKEHQSL